MRTQERSPETDNQVFLRGRLADEPVSRTLPSGDEVRSFRLIVSRPPGGRTRVDALDCSATRSRTTRALGRALPGDVIEVNGRLHRRFWRSPTGLASRYEVEAESVRLTFRRRSAA